MLGLALTKLTSTLGALSWVVRQSAELENAMTSVERMCAYAGAPTEEEELSGSPGAGGGGGAARGPGKKGASAPAAGGGSGNSGGSGGAAAPPGWPRSGAVTFEGVTARYRAGLRPVLSDVSFELKPGQMMGVVSPGSGVGLAEAVRGAGAA
jgi:ABC-type multidrug transport system fused ATPase/permease subunit